MPELWLQRIMLDYLRNLTKSDEEKRQEALNAFLDDALAPKQRQQVERDLAQDEGLRAELEQMRLLQQQMRQLPQRQVRRNFTLDPALYGCPQREPLVQAYPVLRTATALTAFFFVVALTANLILNGSSGMMSSAEPVAMQMESPEAMVAEAAAVEEMAVEEEAAAMDDELLAKAVEELIVAEEVAVDPGIKKPADEAESATDILKLESDAAAPLESAPPPEETKAERAAEDNEMAVMPTMVAEGTVGPELAVEQQVLPMVVETESALSSPRSADGELGEMDASAGIRETVTPADEGVFLANSLSLIVLLFGIVFAILIVLTLLARRRL